MGLEENYFRLLFSQNILPKMLRIFAKNVERAHQQKERTIGISMIHYAEVWKINKDSKIPYTDQLVRNIRWSIFTGEVRWTEKLPPIRVLADELGISINTVRNAYKRLEQQEQQKEDAIIVKNLAIRPKERRVYLNGEEMNLANKEFEVLLFLAENPNIVFSKDTLFDRIWGMDSVGNTATVTVHINRLREKLEKNADSSPFIETVWGAGYRFKVE